MNGEPWDPRCNCAVTGQPGIGPNGEIVGKPPCPVCAVPVMQSAIVAQSTVVAQSEPVTLSDLVAMSQIEWPPDSSRKGAFGHHPGCAPPRHRVDALDVDAWGCVPGCPALEASGVGNAP